MKKLLTLIVLLSLPLIAVVLWQKSPVAEAAPALCYTVESGTPPVVTSLPCNDVFLIFAQTQIGHRVLRQDYCYVIGLSPLILAAPVAEELCVNAQRNAGGGGGGGGGGAGADEDPEPTGDGTLENPSRQIECDGADCVNDNYLVVMAKWAINILGALVGVVVLAVIVFAGIEYSSSGGDPNRTASAKSRIVNAIIALVAYMFLYIILQWLIPGGLFA